jgi:hypothetical protein
LEQAAVYQATNNEIFLMADRLRDLREMKAELESRLKEVNAQIEEAEQTLAQAMLAEEMQNFTRNGQMFYLTTKTYASPVAERKPELFAWLKEHGYGDLVQETVHTNTLAAFVREQLEENDKLPDGLDELVNVYEKISVGVRKAQKKSK